MNKDDAQWGKSDPDDRSDRSDRSGRSGPNGPNGPDDRSDTAGRRRRDDEDDAAVIIAIAVLTAGAGTIDPVTDLKAPRSVWGDPAHRTGVRPAPGPDAWWASGLPR